MFDGATGGDDNETWCSNDKRHTWQDIDHALREVVAVAGIRDAQLDDDTSLGVRLVERCELKGLSHASRFYTRCSAHYAAIAADLPSATTLDV